MAGVHVGTEDVAADPLDRCDVTLVAERTAALTSSLFFLAKRLALGQLLFDRPLRSTAVGAAGQHDRGVAIQRHFAQLLRIQLAGRKLQLLVKQEPGRANLGGGHALAHHQCHGWLAQRLDAIAAQVNALAAAPTGQRMHLHAGSACGGAHRVQQRRALQRLPGHRNDDAAGGEVRLALCGGGSERLEGCACTQALALQHRQRPARVVVAPVDDISKPGLAAKHLALPVRSRSWCCRRTRRP
ncbi:hypothetical protein G6F35_013312 [Rhizopus arrhizus]|nr:hypothetical protein G6F35_013312 [Rhizopus arrhizus]